MATKTKNILALNGNKALDFLMKSEQFHGFELPEYFDFEKVLVFVRKPVAEGTYTKGAPIITLQETRASVFID